jgi:hypothetical protein
MLKNNFRYCMLILVLSINLSSCSEATHVTPISCTGNEISVQNSTGDSSWSWSNIVVGKSTGRDVAAKFGKPKSTLLWPNADQPQACIHYYGNDDDFFAVWLAGDRVIGIEFRRFAFDFARSNGKIEIPTTFEEARDVFGYTELVGWSERGHSFRSVVWAEQGIQVEISLDTDRHYVEIARYFIPISPGDFHNSSFSQLVLDENPTEGTDFVDRGPKDPFEWNK